ncbi:DUF2088 domain-containing protein [bacterium]|nr:MAG: DUF2088 domain-containing protein [bacterium]MCL4230574.1 DUF2088 domain-containing protein [Dehalococcoidia bacterium]
MNIITLPFGESTIAAELPERARAIGLPVPGSGGGSGQTREEREQTVAVALANPSGLPRIRDSVRPGGKVLIAFDDPTVRGSGDIREVIIEACLAELREAGVGEKDVSLLCANALHRKFTHEELARDIGPGLVERFRDRLTCHDAEDWENLVSFGTTANGYHADLLRAAAEADLTIYVNAGCFLGFSGGWKSIAVGLATWRSIRSTHTPDGMSMSVRHNRMHAVLDELGEHIEAKLGKRFFKIEMVMANATKIGGIWAGGVSETRSAALEYLESRNPPRRNASPERADVVIYGVADTSPYAVFARPNPILTLISSGLGYQGGYIEALGKPGCTVIMATPAREEWDMEHHPAYREAWSTVFPGYRDAYEIDGRFVDEFASKAEYIDRYRNGVAFHPVHAILATQPLRRLKHAGRVIVAGAEDPAVPAHVGFESAPTVEEALRMAEAAQGRDCSVVAIGLAGDPGAAPRSVRL